MRDSPGGRVLRDLDQDWLAAIDVTNALAATIEFSRHGLLQHADPRRRGARDLQRRQAPALRDAATIVLIEASEADISAHSSERR